MDKSKETRISEMFFGLSRSKGIPRVPVAGAQLGRLVDDLPELRSQSIGRRWVNRGSATIAFMALLQFMSVVASPAVADDTDCIENGGKAICTRPTLGRPTMGTCVTNALSPTTNAEAWCEAAVPGPIYDESVVKQRIECLPQRQFDVCHVDPIEISWAPQGATSPYPTFCWNMTASVRLGFAVVHPSVKNLDSNGACTVSAGYYPVIVRKDTPAECPRGYTDRTLSNGEIECWRIPTPPPACTTECTNNEPSPSGETLGNPIQIVSLTKIQAETDYRSPGGLEFTRTYQSMAYYRPLRSGSAVVKAFGDYWTHTYERRIYAVANSSYTIATALRPSGSIKYFRADGLEYLNQGVSDKLTSTAQGWRYVTVGAVVEEYDANGVLQSINDHGRVTTLAYSDANTPVSVAPGPGYLVQVSDSTGHSLTFRYDAEGRMTTLVDPDGQITTYEFNGPSAIVTGNLSFSYRLVTKVTYPDAATRTYYYNEQTHTGNTTLLHALTGVMDEAGERYASWTYSSTGYATRSELAAGVEKVDISLSSPRPVTDALGNVTTYNYQQVGGVWRTTSRQAPCVSGVCPNVESYQYDAVTGDLTRRTDPKGIVTLYDHDAARHLQTSRTEASGTSKARTITTQWHPDSARPTQIDEPGRRTDYTYDSNGNVLTQTTTDLTAIPNASRTWTYAYNTRGQVLTADGPRTDVSDVTTYAYYECTTGNECGQIESITNALEHTTTYNSYNAHGQPLTMTDSNGVATTLAYDLRQRLTSRTVAGEQTTFEYWPTGLLKKATLPDGSYLQYNYDLAHRLASMQDSEGNRIVYTHDLMSNVTKEETFDPSNALTRTRTQVFNALNQLQKSLGAAGTTAVTTTFGYDSNGNQTSISAPLGRNTTQVYDEFNRLTQVTDPGGGVTPYGYNALDQLISVTDPRNLATSYSYNAFGDVTQQVSPDTATTTNTYDSAGNLQTSTDARSKTGTYVYDALNRVASITYPDQALSYTYDTGSDQKGRLTQVSDVSGSTHWTYDPLGRVLTRQQSMGAITKMLSYGYDTSGRLQTLTLPSGNAITYGYTDGKVTSLNLNGSTTILSNVLYQPFGPTRGWTWGSSTFAIREYDADGKITDIDSAGLKNYSYDDAQRITGIADAGNLNLSQNYGYDPLDRLTSASGANLSRSWTYDANGNRLMQDGSIVGSSACNLLITTSHRTIDANAQWPFPGGAAAHGGYVEAPSIEPSNARCLSAGWPTMIRTMMDGEGWCAFNGETITTARKSCPQTLAISTTSNRLNSISGSLTRTYTYDAAGNTTSDGTTTFTYNDAGRMISATKAGTTATYAINALGQRIKKTVAGASTYFVYDEAGHLVGEYDSSGNVIEETVWFGDIPVAALKPNGSGGINTFYIHADHLNTPRRISRPTDNVIVWRWDSDPFGTAAANEDPDGDTQLFAFNLRFPGQVYDAETGLSYNWHRYYSADVGRYLQSDPIGLRGGLNTYLYANANPVRHTDPTGLDPWAGGSVGGRVDMLIGGFGARTGFLSNAKTGETCTLTLRCVNLGIGVLGAFGAEGSISLLGPQCGRDLDGLGVSLTLDAVAPGAPGFGGSIDISGGGLGASIGPTGGAGIFGGVSFCYAQVISCRNTPCECTK